MKRVGIVLAGLLLFVFQSTAWSQRRPNVILILTDDQGTVDLNVYGAKDLVTPNMDALATRGVRFTQFYAAAPVCSPSRAAVLTGQNPHRAGVPGNVSSQRGGKTGLPPAKVTIAEMLKAEGYKTAHIGKWHLGYSPSIMPNAQGFDHSFGHMGGCIDNYSHFFYWNGPNRHDLYRNGKEVFADGKFFGDLMVEEANTFMQKNREDPFFIYFAINMPHYPYQGDDRWRKHYEKLAYPRNLYAAFLSTIDDRVGQLMAKVRELGLDEDTIVIFQSDHGHSEEVRAHGGGGDNGPHRGAKFSLYEGGIRVPAAISWPGKIPAGKVRSQFATACDWLPTLATYCRAELPSAKLDGKDIGEVILDDAESPHETFCWQTGKRWAVRKGNWKLISNGEGTKLYEIPNDLGERNDRSAAKPEVVSELKSIHRSWREGNES